VEYIAIADRAAQMAAYISNQLSYIGAVKPEEEAQLQASAKDTLWYYWPRYDWDVLSFFMEHPLFKDLRVRKAYQLALDYGKVNDPIYGTKWAPAAVLHSLFPEAFTPAEVLKMPGYNKATKAADIAEAVKLMDAAGHKEGVGMEYKLEAQGASGLDFITRMKQQFESIWPKSNIKISYATDGGAFQARLQKGDWEARFANHNSLPDAVLDARTNYYTGGSRNYQRDSQPWIDETLDKAFAGQTSAERKAALRPFLERYQNEGLAMIYTAIVPDLYAVHGNVGGLDLVSGAWMYLGTTSPRWLWQTEA
jgi:ABC-type transport system substrate-binding protein